MGTKVSATPSIIFKVDSRVEVVTIVPAQLGQIIDGGGHPGQTFMVERTGFKFVWWSGGGGSNLVRRQRL